MDPSNSLERWLIWRWRLRYEEWCKIEKKLIWKIYIDMGCFSTCIRTFFFDSSFRFFGTHYNLSLCVSLCVYQRQDVLARWYFIQKSMVFIVRAIANGWTAKGNYFRWSRLSQSDMKLYYSITRRTSHMIRISLCSFTYSKRMEIMRYCRSYFRCSIQCSHQSKRHYRDVHRERNIHTKSGRARRKAPSGSVNKQNNDDDVVDKKKTRITQKDIEIRNSTYIQIRNETGLLLQRVVEKRTMLHK